MAQIDHTAQTEVLHPPAPAPAPAPAHPITADQLLELEERQRTLFNEKDNGQARIRTGCQEIDEYVLCAGKDQSNGGFERGIVVGLSAADGDESTGSRVISLNLIASVLLQNIDLVNTIQKSQSESRNTIKPKAVVIDTTGSFSLPLLVKILRSRLLKRRYEMRSRDDITMNLNDGHSTDEIDTQKEVNALLELVAISRVFDIEGLWEVLSELGRPNDQPRNNRGDQEIPTITPSRTSKSIEGEAETLHKMPDEICDSEEEDIELTPPPPPPAKPTTPPPSSTETSPEILIIDSMHYLISHLFTHSEKVSAHNLLSLLSRTLHTLTHTQNILTILHNTTISTKSNFINQQPSRQPPPPPPPPPPTIQSIFNSTAQKPSLGRIFDDFLHLHIMISKLPKKREDAEILYCRDDTSHFGNEDVAYSFVFEVLRDECPVLGGDRKLGRRFGDREQRWGVFEMGGEGWS
ncbi:hypothetical protein BCON_0263g00110 [Botryotinia convoluta]|uniref:DNA recombination and repair protein Rad51-like C-terminal domain-containing protein n=1 Tax=Botryotinia convoluta TaxID=54673 RepID=A0A4Z1HM41_9HELO|nr:hypothetical protein BCON_0263g00110 [Botryotinia convoluta]